MGTGTAARPKRPILKEGPKSPFLRFSEATGVPNLGKTHKFGTLDPKMINLNLNCPITTVILIL